MSKQIDGINLGQSTSGGAIQDPDSGNNGLLATLYREWEGDGGLWAAHGINTEEPTSTGMGLTYGLKHNSQLSLPSYCRTSCNSGEKSANARAQFSLKRIPCSQGRSQASVPVCRWCLFSSEKPTFIAFSQLQAQTGHPECDGDSSFAPRSAQHSLQQETAQ